MVLAPRGVGIGGLDDVGMDSFADSSGKKRHLFRLGGSGNVYGDCVKVRVGGEIFP